MICPYSTQREFRTNLKIDEKKVNTREEKKKNYQNNLNQRDQTFSMLSPKIQLNDYDFNYFVVKKNLETMKIT